MKNNISIVSARSKLLYIWMTGAGILFLVLMIQTLNGTFEKTTEEGMESFSQQVWGWFIPMIFPTITLMLGTLTLNFTKQEDARLKVNPRTFFICLGISVFYILLLLIHVLGWPAFRATDPLKVFNTANFYLAPIQSIVVLLIGIIFLKKGE
ncbi:MAG: hypothetical protein EOO01_05805 [Chitinophagaceae bacterium]|nr:MAG: hypothetical protein EOO01_05805 [Chitinophagaceae bacterium]